MVSRHSASLYRIIAAQGAKFRRPIHCLKPPSPRLISESQWPDWGDGVPAMRNSKESGMNANRPEKLSDIEQGAAAAESSFEGEIRAFVRKDLTAWRKSTPDPAGDAAVASVDTLIARVSGASVEEIDRMIAELQKLRGMLTTEGERIRREITGFAGLSQSAMTSLKIMAESVAQFGPDAIKAQLPSK
jgi:hypothetical protein